MRNLDVVADAASETPGNAQSALGNADNITPTADAAETVDSSSSVMDKDKTPLGAIRPTMSQSAVSVTVINRSPPDQQVRLFLSPGMILLTAECGIWLNHAS